MSKRDCPDAERAAMVALLPDGRWGVHVSDVEGTDGARRWRQGRIFRTEQEADIYARSILPYCNAAWDQRWGPRDDIPEAVTRLKRPGKGRRPQHRSDD